MSFAVYEPWPQSIFRRQEKCNLCGEIGPIYWTGSNKAFPWRNHEAKKWQDGHREYHIDQIRRKR